MSKLRGLWDQRPLSIFDRSAHNDDGQVLPSISLIGAAAAWRWYWCSKIVSAVQSTLHDCNRVSSVVKNRQILLDVGHPLGRSPVGAEPGC